MFHCDGATLSANSRRLAVLILVLSLVCAGCKTVGTEVESAENPSAKTKADDEAHSVQQASHAGAVQIDPAALELILAEDSWFEQVQPRFAKRDDVFLRWHNSRLEPLLRLPAADRPELAHCSESSNPVVAATAAIMLARWKLGNPTTQLVSAIRSDQLSSNLRCAAAEALGLVDHHSPVEKIRELLAPFDTHKSFIGDLRHDEEAENTDLHADLIRALARHAAPGDERWFSAALSSPAGNVRLEAILALESLARLELPEAALELCRDPDARIRVAALRAIVAHRSAKSDECLQQSLQDSSAEVRATASSLLATLHPETEQRATK